MALCLLLRFFFFHAEDRIRDGRVPGVQTCALPIRAQRVQLRGVGSREALPAYGRRLEERVSAPGDGGEVEDRVLLDRAVVAEELAVGAFGFRSEERRVGKEWRRVWTAQRVG